MKLECSLEELVLLCRQLANASPTPTRQPENILGLMAPPSKEMQDYMETVQNFAFEHSVNGDKQEE